MNHVSGAGDSTTDLCYLYMIPGCCGLRHSFAYSRSVESRDICGKGCSNSLALTLCIFNVPA